jgi:hypothetical protein
VVKIPDRAMEKSGNFRTSTMETEDARLLNKQEETETTERAPTSSEPTKETEITEHLLCCLRFLLFKTPYASFQIAEVIFERCLSAVPKAHERLTN